MCLRLADRGHRQSGSVAWREQLSVLGGTAESVRIGERARKVNFRARHRLDEPAKLSLGLGRGRDEHRCPPPAQIRTSGITAYYVARHIICVMWPPELCGVQSHRFTDSTRLACWT